MKIKIKDLALFDVNNACLKYSCRSCPLCIKFYDYSPMCIIHILDHSFIDEWKDILEKEIDI